MADTSPPTERLSIAIILGVSDYDSKSIQTLKGCRDDALAMVEIIRSDKKFVDHLLLTGNVPASQTKQKIVDFLAKYKGTKVDEVVFYYSGHGDYGADDFFYLLSDYDPTRKRQTVLENSELDDLLRGVGPRLAVKIVDACHSGVAYVKAVETFRKQLVEKTQAAFQDCYFLFSSLRNQSSFQEPGKLSDFTAAIVSAVLKHPGPQIRYKELIDYLRDTFDQNQDQTPYFVVQGDMSDYFISIRDDMKAKLGVATTVAPSIVPAAKAVTLLELIQMDAQKYSTKAEADAFLEAVRGAIAAQPLPEVLAGAYRTDIEVDPDDLVPSAKEIGNWLVKNGTRYFANPQYTTERYTVRVPDVPDEMKAYHTASLGLMGLSNVRLRDETRSREVVSGFKPTVTMPFQAVVIRAEPGYANLERYECWIVPIVNRTHAAFFVTILPYRWDGWDSHQVAGKVETLVVERGMKATTAAATADDVLKPFHERVMDKVNARFAPEAAAETDSKKS